LDFQYQYPHAFWLLTAIILFLLIYFGYLLWKRRAIRRMGNPELVKALSKNHSSLKSGIKFTLLLLAFALGCLALSNPRKPDGNSGEEKKGVDILIALDVSNSMLATDVPPSRLDRAKQFISRLVDRMPDDRVGLMLFAGNSYIQMPLTFDHGAAKIYVSAASPASIPSQGTSLSDALEKGQLAFEEESDRFRSIILITDGETHDENALKATEDLAAKGIMVNAIGIGSIEGTTISDTATGEVKKDESGNPVISKLNEDLLKEIANISKGTYIYLDSSEDAVKAILSQYAQIEKKALVDTSLFTYQTFYAWLALPMLILLLLEIFLTNRKNVRNE
jgi:Ca-activated chloride channel family protein